MTATLTVKNAAALIGRSTDTIYRWKAEGIDITSAKALREYAEICDMRSKGKTRILAMDRLYSSPTESLGGGIRSHFPASIDRDAFIDLPFPGCERRANLGLSIVGELKVNFTNRLEELRSIGHAESIEMATEELAFVTESFRLLESVLEAYLC
jgi:hypothetical protein